MSFPSVSSVRISKAINELPPRRVVILDFAEAFDYNIIEKLQSIILDIQISNRSGASIRVRLDGQKHYTVGASADQTHSNVQLTHVKVSDTSDAQLASGDGFLILQVLPIAEMQRVKAVDVR